MIVYEVIEEYTEIYESWSESVGLYISKEQADRLAEEMNANNDTEAFEYYVVERDLIG